MPAVPVCIARNAQISQMLDIKTKPLGGTISRPDEPGFSHGGVFLSLRRCTTVERTSGRDCNWSDIEKIGNSATDGLCFD
jgi:hypothetical protein